MSQLQKIQIGIILLLTLLAACTAQEPVQEELTLQDEIPDEPVEEKVEQVTPEIEEEPEQEVELSQGMITENSFSLAYGDRVLIDLDKDGEEEYTFEITEILDKKGQVILTYTIDNTVKIAEVESGKIRKLEDNISFYIGSLDIINIPELDATANIFIGEFDDDQLYFLEQDENEITIEGVTFRLELFNIKQNTAEVIIQGYQDEYDLVEQQSTQVGPMNIRPEIIDKNGQTVIARILYRENVLYNITQNPQPIIVDGNFYKINLKEAKINTDLVSNIEVIYQVKKGSTTSTITAPLEGNEKALSINIAPQKLNVPEDERDSWVLTKITG